MIRTKYKKIISAILTGTLFAVSFPCVPNNIYNVRADEISDAQEKKDEASAKKQEAQEKLSRLESEKEDIMDVIESLDNEICSYESTINDLKDQKNKLLAKAAIIETNLQNAYIAEKEQYEDMKDRICFAYENGDADYIGALMSIKEYSSVTNQSEYVSQVSSYDQKQLNELLEIEINISDYKESITENVNKINELTSEAEDEQEALQVMQDGKQATLEEYNIQIADTEYSIEELEALEAEQDATIAYLEQQAAARRAAAEAAAKQQAEQQAQQEAQNNQSTQDNTSTASPTDANQNNQQTQNDQSSQQNQNSSNQSTMNSYSGGAFKWPMPTSYTISSPYGQRVAPTEGATTFHRGIDISCPSGSTVVAAADGVVAYTGYLGAGGNCVMVDHGNGITTCYFHLSDFTKSVGANVTAGEDIALSGNTGVSTGPHLHFAVRVNGEYVDPMGYL